jgi:serine/threonine protein kinase
MGVVFKAKDLRKEEAQDRDPSVAIKFLSSEFRKHPEALKALQRETRRAQTLAHPNIVTVYDFDRDGTLIFMTMEFLGGEPLDRFIQRHPQGVRFKEAWPIIEGAGRALMYAHEQGVVHADFKPGNVFVADGAKGRQVKVLDFGIARALVSPGDGPDEGTKFDAGSLGALTPAYASPEMLLSEDPDPRDDVYALACVAYELLTGRHPFGGVAAVRAAHEGLKVKRTPGMRRRQFKALVRGLAFKRSDRTPSVESFLDEMAGPLGVKGREMRRAILSTGFTAIAVTAIGVALWLYMRPDPDEVFVRNLMKDAKARVEQLQSTASGLPYEPDLQARDAFISQGSDYIYLAQQPFDPGLLSEGVSSAYGAFRAALEIDPSSREAAEGILEIVRLYETEAERALEAGYFEKAAQLAAYGLKGAPGRDSLEQIRTEAAERIPAGETTRSDGGTG